MDGSYSDSGLTCIRCYDSEFHVVSSVFNMSLIPLPLFSFVCAYSFGITLGSSYSGSSSRSRSSSPRSGSYSDRSRSQSPSSRSYSGSDGEYSGSYSR